MVSYIVMVESIETDWAEVSLACVTAGKLRQVVWGSSFEWLTSSVFLLMDNLSPQNILFLNLQGISRWTQLLEYALGDVQRVLVPSGNFWFSQGISYVSRLKGWSHSSALARTARGPLSHSAWTNGSMLCSSAVFHWDGWWGSPVCRWTGSESPRDISPPLATHLLSFISQHLGEWNWSGWRVTDECTKSHHKLPQSPLYGEWKHILATHIASTYGNRPAL